MARRKHGSIPPSVTLARLIGRRIAREELDRLDAANDNAPEKDAGETIGDRKP